MGLVNRLCEPGEALAVAQGLAAEIAAFPQTCMRRDRLSVLEQWGLPEERGTGRRARPWPGLIAGRRTGRGHALHRRRGPAR